MYEPTRVFANFFVAGFKYWDGPFVLSQLEIGEKLNLVPEFDNPYDSQAIAIYRGQTKLGFVPRDANPLIAQMAFYGHVDVFEPFVLAVNKDANPREQLYVSIRIKDSRA